MRRHRRDPLGEALRARAAAAHLDDLIAIVKGDAPPQVALEIARQWVARACRLENTAIVDRLTVVELRELAELERETDVIWADVESGRPN